MNDPARFLPAITRGPRAETVGVEKCCRCLRVKSFWWCLCCPERFRGKGRRTSWFTLVSRTMFMVTIQHGVSAPCVKMLPAPRPPPASSNTSGVCTAKNAFPSTPRPPPRLPVFGKYLLESTYDRPHENAPGLTIAINVYRSLSPRVASSALYRCFYCRERC